MVTQCEINTWAGVRCDSAAAAWCRRCDRAVCAEHHRFRFDGWARLDQCQSCTDDSAAAELAAQVAYRQALTDISDCIRALRRQPGAATQVASTRATRTPLLRPWARHCVPLYSIRYWPVGRFAWLQSCAGGFGEHELMPLGVGEYETVVNERGQITRSDEDEIVAGRPVLAQLVSAQAATVTIAANLRVHLRAAG